MNALADAKKALGRMVELLVEAAPVAWRHDPLFRGAAIGTGIAMAVLLLRLVGPHDPALERWPVTTLRTVPGVGAQTISGPAASRAQPSSGDELPKISPSHALSDATITPTPNTDRFGTFTPGKHP